MTKKTTTICCAVALLATTAATPTLSQTKGFEGFSIGVGGTAIGNNTNISGSVASENTGGDTINNTLAQDFGKTNLVPYINASYAFSLNNNWLLGFGITYDLSKNKSGQTNSDLTTANVYNGIDDGVGDNVLADIRNVENLKTTFKDHKSIYLAPTYVINNNNAIFAKIGYHEQKGTLTYTNNQTVTNTFTTGEDTIDGTPNYDSENITISGSKNFKGYGYGLGFKTLLSNNLYMQIDAEMISYDKETVTDGDYTFGFKPKSVNASISLGYKF
jgi:opacity protein-like surface antigen